MKRNNSKRLGQSEQPQPADASEPAMAAVTQQGLSDLSFVTGTDIVDLPSAGGLYPPGHQLHGKESIELRHMTAKEEDILTNPAFIRNGTALDRLLNSLLVDKEIDLDSLIVGDKNALLLAARISAYGPEYGAKVTCPACGTNQDFKFNLDEIGSTGPDEFMMSLENAEITQNKTILVKTPRTNLTFELRPMIGADEKEMAKAVKQAKKHGLGDNLNLTDKFSRLTVSINGVSDTFEISRVYEQLPAYDFRHLRRAYEAAMPDIELLAPLTCKECGAEEVIGVPLNANFFWPDIKV